TGEALFGGGRHGRQYAQYGAGTPVQAQFGDEDGPVEAVDGDLPGGGHDPAGDRQIEEAAGLGQAGRGQADHHRPRGPVLSAVDAGRAGSVAGRSQCRGGKSRPGDGAFGPAAQVRLELHDVALDPDQGDAVGTGHGHRSPPRSWETNTRPPMARIAMTSTRIRVARTRCCRAHARASACRRGRLAWSAAPDVCTWSTNVMLWSSECARAGSYRGG